MAEVSWSSDSLERGRKASVAVGSECWGRAVAPSQQAWGSVWGSQGAGVVSGPLGVGVVIGLYQSIAEKKSVTGCLPVRGRRVWQQQLDAVLSL